MTLTLLSGPAVEPLSTAEVKDHLRLDGTLEDAYLGALVTAARQACETYISRALITQTWKWTLDQWPSQHGDGGWWANNWWDGVRDGAITQLSAAKRTLDLPRGPLQSVTSVTVLDDEGSETTLATSSYIVAPGLDGRLALRAGQVWPSPTAALGGIEITFVAGFGDSWNDVPATLRHGMLLLVAHLYDNREAVAEQDRLPQTVLGLWRPWRQQRI